MSDPNNNLIQRGEVWYVRTSHQGKQYLRSTGTKSITQARSFRTAFLRKLRADRIDLLDDSRLRKPERKPDTATLAEVFAVYLDEVAVRGKPSINTAHHNIAELRRIEASATQVPTNE